VHASVATLPANQASALRASLTATDTATVETALAPATRAAYERRPFRMLPAGSNVRIESSQLTVTGDSGTVPALVTGGAVAGRWLLLLIHVDGRWLLYGTRKA
jgi:hypothetical protein